MKLTELATTTDAKLSIRWNSHLEIWQADFEHCEVKEGGILRGAWGGGQTPGAAVAALAKEYAGNRLVFFAWGDGRREVQAPKTLTGD